MLVTAVANDNATKTGKAAGDNGAARIRRHVDRRIVALRSDRMSWFNHWRDLSAYLVPRRGRFLVTPNDGRRGSPLNQKVIDSTATLALRVLSSGLMSGMTSPARPWFQLTLGDRRLAEGSPVKLWLDEVTKRLLRVFAKSNAYNCLATVYEELGLFGTGVLLVEEDPRDIIRCRTLTAGEYFLANDEHTEVNTLYREFTRTVAQVVEQFGLDSSSPTVKSLYDSGSVDREVIVCHAVEPNHEYVPNAFGAKGMPFRSVYWEWGTSQDMVLEVRGFHEFPACCPRWHLISNDAYGRSPGMDALGDVKALQIEQKRKAQAIDKMVDPPMLGDASLKNEQATLLPGGVTYVSGASQIGFKPVYEVQPPLQGLVEDIQEVQGRIDKCFFTDLFLAISQLDTVRTAQEIIARKQEQMLQLGTVLERLHKELLNPLVSRTFAIMARGSLPYWRKGKDGLLPMPPRGLQGFDLDVEYVSVLADAQKAVATTGIERLFGFVGNIAAARPDALDNIDFDEGIAEYADALGVSSKLILAPGKVAAIRAQRAQQQQQQLAFQNSLAAAQGAQTLSNTDVGGGQNALQKMLGGAQ